MPKILVSAAGAGLLISLAACGQQSGNDNHSAASNAAQAPANQMVMDDTSNPYAQSEREMHEGMMAAKGDNISDTWARKMIEHHRGALTMSEVLLARDPNSRFADMARKTIKDQSAEIQQIEHMLREHPDEPAAK